LHQGYPAFDETKEDLAGVNVTSSRRAELAEALGDAPIYILGDLIVQQLFGWQAYLIKNSSGQLQYPKDTNHFNPDAVIFDKRHRSQIIMSNIGIGLLLTSLAAATYVSGFKNVACHCGCF
jgi:omega-6 fatty acid desaturase (delta-12 desaturase)